MTAWSISGPTSYSLGATFYEMLTGRPPFVSTDPVELVHAHLARTPVPPPLNPLVPRVLSESCSRLLAKMPEARYQSAGALLEDLREAQARLARHGAIAPFELGLVDLAAELPLPERLYGREERQGPAAPRGTRRPRARRRARGARGPAGIGKSALVAELRAPVARRGGRFLTAKFEPQRGRAPYAPFAGGPSAPLAAGLLAAPDVLRRPGASASSTRSARTPARHRLSSRARAAHRHAARPPGGGPGRDGEPASPRASGVPAGARPRERPLVLFLDDLQWADLAFLRPPRGARHDAGLSSLLIARWRCGPRSAGAEHVVTRSSPRALGRAPLRQVEAPPLDPGGGPRPLS